MRRILSLSYDNLPQHLKTCLLYLSIFPEDYEIERDQVVRRWIAEGFINTEGGQDLKEIGNCHFNDLINRSLIQPVKIQYDGRVDSCRVHDMILDLLISKSIEENFATFIGGKNQKLVLHRKARRLSLHYYFHEHTMVPSTMFISQCRSLSIFGYSEHMPSLSNFRALRVLDIENELGELQHLHTLDLGETKIKKFPKSIVLMQNLTCLCVNNLELPEEIGNLHALQELSVIKINKNSSASSLLGLGSLIKLRILRLCWCIVNTRPDSKAYVDNLLSSLRRLGRANLRRLYIQSYYGYSIEFLLDSWFPIPHLLQTFCMTMEYHFPRIPFWITSLENLSYLDINVDSVEQKALDVLGNLPSLMYLWVTAKATVCKERLFIRSSMFISLKEFHFTCLSSGVDLMFEAGAMTKLVKLMISFYAGDDLYSGFQHLSSLKHLVAEIICSSMTAQEVQALEEAIRSAVDILPNCPTLEVRIW
ncbi:hypothetical protein HU200_052796 [Digitaria exilis]|uniref:Uncharacterized protein n=1 Tax=Digitaria exilis TaxID=1010633 RepID=A0A835ALL5_9POAL|nr:hypothetical protein HU200_052796 [Digitaria exilis]